MLLKKMMLKGSLVLIFLGFMFPVSAQSEEEKVMKVIVHLFHGIRGRYLGCARFIPAGCYHADCI
jgi:hypothetical protein